MLLFSFVALASGSCHVVQAANTLTLRSPAFEFTFDTHKLTAVSWTNRLTHETLSLSDGPEVGLDFDASDERIPITGWRKVPTNSAAISPDKEMGYADTAFAVTHKESDWGSGVTPLVGSSADVPVGQNWTWARTHVFLPTHTSGRKITFVIGGNGLFDYRYTRVFVNGHEIGLHQFNSRWHEPGHFPIVPGSDAYKFLKFGGDNIIALQLSGFFSRTPTLDAVDPMKNRAFSYLPIYPPQYEQYVVVGDGLSTPKLHVNRVEKVSEGATGEVKVHLSAPSVNVTVTYSWNAKEAVLHKRVDVTCKKTARLLNVRLGTYTTHGMTSDGEQGFPVYIDDQFFATLAHPAGWATGENGRFELKQYPGVMLGPGRTFESMDAVLGVAAKGQARPAFLAHMKSRMRRTVFHHDHPYAFFESFGSWPSGEYWGSTEADMFHLIAEVKEFQEQTSCKFDDYAMELWMDHYGDGHRPDLKRFPREFKPIVDAIKPLGMNLGLWTDSSWKPWTFSGNPVTAPSTNSDGSYGEGDRPSLCRASEPFRTMFDDAQMRLAAEGVRLFKFDNLTSICYNPHHDHLPGIYSTEAIMNGVIGTLDKVGTKYPDAFLMLYWGHRSPWWLVHADTLFEGGINIEAASPAGFPTPYARDSVTVGLDQSQAFAVDVPPLGKDSLGVWLSDWPWNSSVGKTRWQEGFVMDMCRGSMLAQPWTDWTWLTQPERQQFAAFVALLRAHPECFGNSTRIIGNPWKHEPYGCRCSGGSRAFFALNNCTWSDASLPISLAGLNGSAWDVYRWYPNPAFVGTVSSAASLPMRAYEVGLFEVVPKGTPPSLGRTFLPESATAITEPSVELPVAFAAGDASSAAHLAIEDGNHAVAKRVVVAECDLPVTAVGGLACVTLELRRGNEAFGVGDVGRNYAVSATLDGGEAGAEPVLGPYTTSCPWQGWRVPVGPSASIRHLKLVITTSVGADVAITAKAHFLPR